MDGDLQKKIATLWDNRRTWLFEKALPLWAQADVDPEGGFHDRLNGDGTPVDEPKRLRVQARQVVVYALAGSVGWQGPWQDMVLHGLRFFREYKDSNGCYPSVYLHDDAQGTTLYDQAFVLLALAHARQALNEPEIEQEAFALLHILRERIARPQGGFLEFAPGPARLQANPNMHLYEAALAWRAISNAPEWVQLASELRNLALSVFIDPITGRLREFFDEHGNAKSDQRTDVEPGHQFEWGSLFLVDSTDLLPTAQRLIADASDTGVDRRREIAMNALTIDGTVIDSDGRLWVQTERLRAALLLAFHTAPDLWLGEALTSHKTIRRYLDLPAPGLWQDSTAEYRQAGSQPAKASSLYHIVNAYVILEKQSQLAAR
jgi:mannose-6-phosphate isomerase